jgi:sterol desaturase/sphingolipid hydroxylase (fatty acid hydroxylase superfamily)
MLRASPESPRMFQSDFIDFFSRVPALVVPVIFVPIILALFTWGVTGAGLGVLPAIGAAVAGFLVWTFAEYWLHRTLFHWVPDTSWGPRMHFILHGVHHDWVNDKYRLVMPPAASLGLGVVFFGLFYVLLGPVWVYPFFAGHVLGYLGYDMAHYYVHHFKPKSTVMKRLRAHHMNHHHNKDGRKFGVSTTLWDHVFRTY